MTIAFLLKNALRHCLLGLGLVLSSAWVHAGPVQCGQTPIRLAFYDFGLFYFEDADKRAAGIDKDLVDELIARTGCKFETQLMSRARIWADLANGSLDMSVSGIQNAERDQFAWFVPYLTMKNYAVVHGNVGKTVHAADDFLVSRSLKFGVVRSFKHGVQQDQWLETLRAQGRVEESPDAVTIFRKLKDHRVDAVFSQPAVYRKLIQELGMGNTVQVQDWTPKEKGVPHALILAKQRFSQEDSVQWGAVIRSLRDTGTLKALYGRYLPPVEVGRMLNY
jgi:polar amino acid transport system substrate-binding protein